MDTGLQGRVVLVTGASGAIGSAIARHFAAEGATVALTYRANRERAEDLAREVRDRGGSAAVFALDQAVEADRNRLVGDVMREVGAPAVVIANAVEWPSSGPETSVLAAAVDANLVGPVAIVDALLEPMRERRFGRIVFVSTDLVGQPMAGPVGYVAAKAGLEAAARVLAVREAAHGILTNVVRPGFTLTEPARTNPDLAEPIRAERSRTPTDRLCTPDDVASAVVYLGSSANSHVNGQVISVAGGRELVR
jgi:3-oxoacyl-[acyl-carrier protein] reductase